MAIPGATGYRNGFSFDLPIRRSAAEDDPFGMDRALHWFGREGRRPRRSCAWGVQSADSQKATS